VLKPLLHCRITFLQDAAPMHQPFAGSERNAAGTIAQPATASRLTTHKAANRRCFTCRACRAGYNRSRKPTEQGFKKNFWEEDHVKQNI
jgi:hypothetical protein